MEILKNLKDFFVPQEDGDDDQYEDSYQRRSSSSERESRDGRDYENSRSYRAEPDKKRQHQNDWCSYDHQQTFQNLHSCSSFQRSRCRLHRASASLSSSSVTSRFPLVSSISR